MKAYIVEGITHLAPWMAAVCTTKDKAEDFRSALQREAYLHNTDIVYVVRERQVDTLLGG